MSLPWHQLPNALTLARCALTPVFVWLLLTGEFRWALLVFVAAGCTDAVDGFLAKQFHWQSRFGAIADPLADKLMVISAMLVLVWLDMLAAWFCLIVIARDLLIVVGAYVYHRMFGPYAMQPSALSKINTVLQIALIVSLLLRLAHLPMPWPLIDALFWLTTASTLLSGGHYVWHWGRRCRREWQTLHTGKTA